jgi:hypothetical protein
VDSKNELWLWSEVEEAPPFVDCAFELVDDVVDGVSDDGVDCV